MGTSGEAELQRQPAKLRGRRRVRAPSARNAGRQRTQGSTESKTRRGTLDRGVLLLDRREHRTA